DIDVESPAPDVWSARGEIPDRASRARAVHQGRGEAELVVHCFEHFLDLASIGDITLESMGDSAAGPDRVDGLARSHLISIEPDRQDRKSTRLNSSHVKISYAVFCLKKKKNTD